MNKIEWPVGEPIEVPTVNWPKTLFLCFWAFVIGIGVTVAAISLGVSPQFINDQDCAAQVNESFFNGTLAGYSYTIETITNRSISCQSTPIVTPIVNYTLIPIECLNMSGAQNG